MKNKPKKNPSRQYKTQLRHRAMGLCMACSKDAILPTGMCQEHLDKRRALSRKKQGCSGVNPRAYLENKATFFQSLLELDWGTLGCSGVAKLHGVTYCAALSWQKKLGIQRIYLMPGQKIVSC